MAEMLEVYKCMKCGNIVEVLHGGAGELVCCGEPMKLFRENTTDAAQEKHVPVIEKTEDGHQGQGGLRRPSHDAGALHRVDRARGGRDGLPRLPEAGCRCRKPSSPSRRSRYMLGSTATFTGCGRPDSG